MRSEVRLSPIRIKRDRSHQGFLFSDQSTLEKQLFVKFWPTMPCVAAKAGHLFLWMLIRARYLYVHLPCYSSFTDSLSRELGLLREPSLWHQYLAQYRRHLLQTHLEQRLQLPQYHFLPMPSFLWYTGMGILKQRGIPYYWTGWYETLAKTSMTALN